MTWLQAIFLALVQGITELFPVSSLGHAVIIPSLLNWKLDQASDAFLPFLVIMHLGTACALLLYFWRDWYEFGTAVVFSRGVGNQRERRTFWLVIVATLPAVLVALLFERSIRSLFNQPVPFIPCALLFVNGMMLLVAERLKPIVRPNISGTPVSKPLEALTWFDAIVIGFCQSLALFPGMSRSGATMVGGYLSGLNHEDAARFSFLTGTPIIIAAVVHELPKMLKVQQVNGAMTISLPMAVAAGVVAGITAFLSVWLLMRWFKTHEVKGYDLYAYYCMAAGVLFFVAEIVKHQHPIMPSFSN